MSNEYITTTEACELIGVSKTVVKKLADEGVLQTWKTPGGHRRLLRNSVIDYINRFSEEAGTEPKIPVIKKTQEPLRVLVVDDDPQIQKLICSLIKNMELEIEIFTANNGYEGLMQFGSVQPNIIFADLMMPKMDGYTMINSMRNYQDDHKATIIVITGEVEADVERKNLPSDVVVMHKPVQVDILKRFIQYEYSLIK